MRVLCFVAAMAVSIPTTLVPMQQEAEACGCTHPPIPVPDGPDDFAINQSGEHIIYEVEEGFVTAHVLIQYAGRPEEFAWIVPVPSVPELSLSPSFGFSLLDRDTRPDISIDTVDDCPVQEWACQQANMPSCNSGGCGGGGCSADSASNFANTVDAGAGAPDASGGGAVDVLDRQVVGSYETVVFSAGDASAAVTWLQDEGFIVNETMSPFMQPYADAGMLFLASRLVAGADTSSIQPLRMRYAADKPMIPLRLTAIAAQPEMTITTYIYGDTHFVPEDFPLATINQEWLSSDSDGRINYPMVLSRAIDEAGGKSFVAEYVGAAPFADFDQGTGCCTAGFDLCNLGGDGVCSCPNSGFDAVDCEEDGPALLEGAAFIDGLAQKYSSLTRLTTRMSAEDMDYDPVFKPEDSTTLKRLS